MPRLVAIAQDLLCIPAATVSIEWAFNQSWDIYAFWQGRLLPETIQATIITNYHIQKEFFDDSIQVVKDTIDIDNLSFDDLQEEADWCINHLNKALKIEYISDDNGDFSRLYRKTAAQTCPRKISCACQDLNWIDSDPAKEVIEHHYQPPVQRTAAKLEALYNVPSSPEQASSVTTPQTDKDDFQELPQTPLGHRADSHSAILNRSLQDQ